MPNIENIKKYKNIHMIGIGGVSMSGIAAILTNWGFNVTGSDWAQSEATDKLNTLGIISTGAKIVKEVKAGRTKSEKSVTKSTYPGLNTNSNQAPILSHWVNIEIAIILNPITYILNKVTFFFFVDANSDGIENANANIGQASAIVYWIGPQYE